MRNFAHAAQRCQHIAGSVVKGLAASDWQCSSAADHASLPTRLTTALLKPSA